MTSQKNEPIIDWELGVKLAGNKHDLAKDLLRLLVQSLPADMNAIKTANTNANSKALLMYVHKLHGAVSYCGVPRLKKVLAAFETAIKKNEVNQLATHVAALEIAVKQVIQEVTLENS